MKHKKKLGKSVLVKDVMAKGFTARKAEEAVKAVIDQMKLALWWGEPVEIPGGTIQAKTRQGSPRREFQRFRNVQTGKIDLRYVKYPGRHRVVKFTPDLNLDLSPLPPSPTQQDSEMRRLASELLGRPVDDLIMAKLQEAVAVQPFKPGALLRRLQEFKNRGWHFDSVTALALQVSAQYWL